MIGGVTMAGHYRSERLPVRIPPYAAGAAFSGALVLGCIAAAIVSFQIAVSAALVRLAEDRVEQRAQATLNPYEIGRPCYERARRMDPGHWMPYLELGNLERSRAFWVRDPEYKAELARLALEHYQKALARNPYDMNVVYGIGRCWYILGEEEKSLEYLRRAVAHWPSNVFYSLQLGIQLREMGRYEEALEALRHAHRAGGWNDPQVQSNLRAVERLLRE
jgi:tetratricopeptide (TPR) repeat protein